MDRLIINTIMRAIGFIVRMVTIGAGFSCLVALAILGPVFYVIWIVLPVLALGFLIFGIISLTVKV